jgi:hypothetical protein
MSDGWVRIEGTRLWLELELALELEQKAHHLMATVLLLRMQAPKATAIPLMIR